MINYTKEVKPTINPANATFHGLFVEKSNAIYYIPNFQRSYAWDVAPHVTQFLTDLNDCYEIEKLEGDPYQHFLGQIILRHAEEKQRGNETRFEVIDGQQRLITFMMVCVVIYKHTNEIMKNNRSLQDRGQEIMDSIKTIVFFENSPRLLLSKKDHRYWEDIIEHYTNFSGVDISPTDTVSHVKMKGALDAIDSFLYEKSYGKDDNQKLKYLEDILYALTNRMHLITVTSEPTEYMFALFQTVNDRGRLLTNGELLRAKTLEALKDDSEKQQVAEQCWDDILSDDEKQTNSILEWCYISFVGKVPEKNPSLFHQYLSNYFIEAQKRHVNDTEMANLLDKIKTLREDVAVCRKIKSGEWPFPKDERPEWQKSRLKELGCRLRHSKAIPILLSMVVRCRMAAEKDQQTRYDDFYRMVDLIDRFYFTYIKICQLDENNFTDAYNQAAAQFRHQDGYSYSAFAKKLWAKEKDGHCIDILREYMSKQVYANKRNHVTETHLLYLLEIFFVDDVENAFSNDSSLDDAVNINPEKLSIEHIYPKGAKKEILDEDMEPYKHHLGNLTLLGKKNNTDLDSKPYSDKKQTYKSSNYRITRDLAKYDCWNREMYMERQHFLEALACKIFDLSALSEDRI
jgi:hypothetical protein